MAFNANVELVDRLVNAVADAAPPQWTKVAYYIEFLEDRAIGLRNKSTASCLGGDKHDVALDNYEVGVSHRAFSACKALYHESVKIGETWSGLLLVLSNDGRFKVQFFYQSTPLLDNDDVATDERIASVLDALA